ncbi:MAG: Holliday junction resolvase RecU [Defluviitaleaceae bacterium]|nr:Holliday junction resolvase RecU [Defluviitaleaceae bacterium]
MGFSNRGLRGSTFEEMINFTNERYRSNSLAIVTKVPTPITPVAIDKENRTITLGYFEKKSTVDYIGVVQGIAICFDAKETRQKNFPINNIHRHQIEFMEEFTKQKGIAFMLVNFVLYDQYFFLPFVQLKGLWDAAQAGGRKSMPYDSFDKKYMVEYRGGYLHYLEAINVYLDDIDTNLI